MAGLVGYSSSSEEEPATPPPAKKRRISDENGMPPLPAAFLDQYSSTVRTSTQDDPSLHGGRKRVMPHVQGNWPAHVYLEWHPNSTEAEILSGVVSAVQAPRTREDNKTTLSHDDEDNAIRSLLQTDLGVSLPLHISLSRPLTLKTEQKDDFLSRLQEAVSERNVHAFHAIPKDLAWHSNQNSTRSFLVLRMQRSADREMVCLLEECNKVATDFDQPLLYASTDKRGTVTTAPEVGEKFHVSVAWSLGGAAGNEEKGRRGSVGRGDEAGPGVCYQLLGRLTSLSIEFAEVKVRIGQDVHTIPLKTARRTT